MTVPRRQIIISLSKEEMAWFRADPVEYNKAYRRWEQYTGLYGHPAEICNERRNASPTPPLN